MHLGGQAAQRGYALAAVLISVAIMSIVMAALLPVWRQQMQREKEAELAFRGEQYARAIYLFNVKNGGQYPPSIDVLVQGRYLRKKYRDPMTEDGEFQPLALGTNQPGPQGGSQTGRGGDTGRGSGSGIGTSMGSGLGGSMGAGGGSSMGSGRGGSMGSGLGGSMGGGRSGQPSPGLGGQPMGGAQGGGGIMTVVSKSKDASIRIYNGASHYNEWRFLYNARGRGMPNQQGSPGGGPTQGRPGMGAPGQGGLGGPGRGAGPGRGSGPVRVPGGRGQ